MITWKDVVLVNGEYHEEEFPISGEMDGPFIYQIDDFISSVAKKYGVEFDEVQTMNMDALYRREDFPKECERNIWKYGAYVDGKLEEIELVLSWQRRQYDDL